MKIISGSFAEKKGVGVRPLKLRPPKVKEWTEVIKKPAKYSMEKLF